MALGALGRKKPVETVYGVFSARSFPTLKNAAMREPFQLQMLAHCFRTVTRLRELADVGANLGLYSVYASRLDECEKITTFEPNPKTYDALCENIALNPRAAELVDARRLAVSGAPGEVAFDARTGFDPGAKVVEGEAENVVMVEAGRIDDAFDLGGARDVFLKMDVEGHEMSALRGAAGFLAARCAFAQIEVLREPKEARRDVRALMRDAGFTLQFRAGADHFFVHKDFSAHGPRLRELFWDKAQVAGRLLMDAGFDQDAFIRNEKAKTGLAQYFNGFLSALK